MKWFRFTFYSLLFMFLALMAIVLLIGCATGVDPNFALQLQAYQEVERGRNAVLLAKAQAEAARYEAIARIGASADRETRTVAILGLALGNPGGVPIETTRNEVPRVPESDADKAYKWAALFVGPASNVLFGYYGYQLGKTQSNNATQASIANTNAFAATAAAGFNSNVGIAGFIQSPAPSLTIGGNGVIGSGSYSVPTTTTITTHTCTGGNGAAGASGGNGGTAPGGAGGAGGIGGGVQC
jgi:hypothetical protein